MQGQADIIAVTTSGAELAAVRDLFLEYAGSLNFSLCFQDFETELDGLPGAYAPPAGILLLAGSGGDVAGCVGVRPLDGGRCEMKRLYVREQHRGTGLGRRLAERAVAFARGAGYRSMVLDTLPQMAAAVRLYRELGFARCAPYYDNRPINSSCLELRF
ncbi:MAG: GNAT family N-acetyltransferase [Burkholderiales bacterium]|nr:GNAT family N-acetyltransferase [Burkholderiales bacterium]